MPRWLRIIRAMIGSGLTFSAGGAVVGALIAVPLAVLGAVAPAELLPVVGRFAVAAFPLGVVFSGALAITARGRSFDKLSLPLFAALGAGVGLLAFALLGASGAWAAWSTADMLANLTILTLMGAGTASGALLLARRARPALPPGEETPRLQEAHHEP